MTRLLLWIASGSLLISCGSNENTETQSELDSLRLMVAENERLSEQMQQVGALMDTIDANRRLLRVNMIEGTTYDDFEARMTDLNDYVRETEQKIESMERSLGQSQSLAATYSRLIAKLKVDLETKTAEMAALQGQVEKYRNENQNLVDLATLQEAELSDKDQQIQAKEQELALLEARIQNIMIQSKMTEADATYARAQAVEEAANRTFLAPKKKKETLQEALDLYKKALLLGKKEAQAKIKELEGKI